MAETNPTSPPPVCQGLDAAGIEVRPGPNQTVELTIRLAVEPTLDLILRLLQAVTTARGAKR